MRKDPTRPARIRFVSEAGGVAVTAILVIVTSKMS